MDSSRAKGLFFINLSVLGAIAVLAIYQIPQPWRGILVGWLIFAASVGTFVLQIAKHHYEFKSQQLKSGKQKAPSRASRRSSRSWQRGRDSDLVIVRSDDAGNGRRVIH